MLKTEDVIRALELAGLAVVKVRNTKENVGLCSAACLTYELNKMLGAEGDTSCYAQWTADELQVISRRAREHAPPRINRFLSTREFEEGVRGALRGGFDYAKPGSDATGQAVMRMIYGKMQVVKFEHDCKPEKCPHEAMDDDGAPPRREPEPEPEPEPEEKKPFDFLALNRAMSDY